MLELRLHPRLAHMLLRSRELNLEALACDLAALLGERDILRTAPGARDSDVRGRLEALRGGARAQEVDRGARERVRRSAEQYRRILNGSGSRPRGAAESAQHDDEDVGVLLAFAYPDRIARRREDDAAGSGRYLLSNGRGARFDGPQALSREPFLVIPELDAGEREARILLATPISEAALERHFASELQEREIIGWDGRERAVIATRTRSLGALVTQSRALTKPAVHALIEAMIAGIRELSLEALPWTRELREWQLRLQFVRALAAERDTGWPDVSDAALLSNLETWPASLSRRNHARRYLARVDLAAALHAQLDWKQQQRLDSLAPTHLEVPSGSRVRVEYDPQGGPPSLSVRLQEVFGWQSTPRIGGAGGVPVVLKLLSPAHRPVQVTRDLASFWKTGYVEVRKELKGRYPKALVARGTAAGAADPRSGQAQALAQPVDRRRWCSLWIAVRAVGNRRALASVACTQPRLFGGELEAHAQREALLYRLALDLLGLELPALDGANGRIVEHALRHRLHDHDVFHLARGRGGELHVDIADWRLRCARCG